MSLNKKKKVRYIDLGAPVFLFIKYFHPVFSISLCSVKVKLSSGCCEIIWQSGVASHFLNCGTR